MINNPEEYEKMNLAEGELWWYNVLHEQTIKAIQQQFKTSSIAILDAACGTGGLIKRLTEQGFSNVQGFDVAPEAVQRAKQKTTVPIALADLRQVAQHYQKNSFDVVICNDAFYFVEQERLADTLRDLLSLLNKGGILILNLPAMKAFKGMHDLSVGIEERWDLPRFKKVLRDSNMYYTRIDHFYWPFVLSPLIWSARMAQRIKLSFFPSAPITSDVSIPNKVLNNIFYNLTKCESHLPFRRGFGSSLFVIVHR